MAPPPSRRPRAKRVAPEVRRASLMDAAEPLFLASGVEAVPVEDIAAAAEVAKGTFYLHFASKAEMVVALRQRFVDTLLADVAAAVAARPEGDWPGRLAAWARSCAAAYLAQAPLHRLVFAAAPPADVQGLSDNPLIRHLAELLAAGARAGAWSEDDPWLTAVFLFNGLHGVVNGPATSSPEASEEERLSAIEIRFLRAVGAGPGATDR